MEEVYSFVDVVDIYPEKIKILDDTILRILKQTVECAIFIREYSGHGFGGICSTKFHLFSSLIYHISVSGRLLRQAMSDKADIIAKFSQTFVQLKAAFDSAVNVQTAFVTFRTAQGLERIGENSFHCLICF